MPGGRGRASGLLMGRARLALAVAVAAGALVTMAGCPALYASRPRFSGRAAPARPQRPARPAPKPVVKPADPRQGKLSWPVPGAVAAGFGVVVDPRYGTKTRKLGVDITCGSGAPVKAAYAGRVSFVDEFMGYGMTVIVDHGGRLHTIYARLKEASATVGNTVREGEVVGYAADTLHFQVRMEGQSVDPERWLRPR
ncbi:MAG: peptidoglycan DD-metalloendopeptidase family protein [bacterium]